MIPIQASGALAPCHPAKLKTHQQMKPSPSLTSALRHLLTVLAASAALLPFVPATADANSTKLPLSIYCFDYAGDLKSVDVRTGQSEFSPINLSTANVIDAGEVLAEDGKIILHGPAAGDDEHPVVATLEVGTISKPLAVLAPAPAPATEEKVEGEADAPAYRSHVIEADDKTFPMGSYRFVNLSPYPVRINLGEHSMEIESGTDKLFNPKVAAGELLAVTIEYQLEENWLAVSSSRWAYRKDRRTLVCIQQDPQTQRMLLKSIPLRE